MVVNGTNGRIEGTTRVFMTPLVDVEPYLAGMGLTASVGDYETYLEIDCLSPSLNLRILICGLLWPSPTTTGPADQLRLDRSGDVGFASPCLDRYYS